MVSLELIRRYPFFAGLSLKQLNIIASAASEEKVEAGHFFMHEKDETPFLYLITEGQVTIVIELPGKEKEIVVGVVGPGDVFGWSALVPPHIATAGVKAATSCTVITIDCRQLLKVFENDPRFGYLMMMKVAQITRDRVTTLTTETLAYLVD